MSVRIFEAKFFRNEKVLKKHPAKSPGWSFLSRLFRLFSSAFFSSVIIIQAGFSLQAEQPRPAKAGPVFAGTSVRLLLTVVDSGILRITLVAESVPGSEETGQAGSPAKRTLPGLYSPSGNHREPVRAEASRTDNSAETAADIISRLNSSPVLDLKEISPLIFDSALTPISGKKEVRFSGGKIVITTSPLSLEIISSGGRPVQKITFEDDGRSISFIPGEKPLYGLGGGGQTLDRRGIFDFMNNGHRSGEYQIFGSRLPVPFLISTEGWAIFVHRPYSPAFDLRGPRARLVLKETPGDEKEAALPLDLFLILSRNPSDSPETPAEILAGFTKLTGRPVLPPRWALGYFQSHRTLEGPEEILRVAENFRQRQLPCDGLIYLGTGYCPSGWNLGHGSLEFNPKTFPDPEAIIDRLHRMNFRVILHKNNAPRTLHGSYPPAPGEKRGPDHVADYWQRHLPAFSLGVDGWWPDDGDELPVDSRLARHFIYYAGPLSSRPNIRPFSLHRTGYAGMQRYGGWVWSGDVYSTWETLRAHVAVGINFSLSASPYWGTDIGGFWPTPELTGELYLRWFQFMSFAPLFRSHGRVWHLRLPWGWSSGEAGPPELMEGMKGTGLPPSGELMNPEVENICRQYLNLRYQLLPYNYTLAREAFDTGLPLIRALWVHYPGDSRALEISDEYLWGRDFLIAPVVEKGATVRRVYLPSGLWYDFWSNTRVMGGQIIARYVDLSTMPVYVRAGAIIPLGPVIQYTEQKVQAPLTIMIYPGADGSYRLYQDDGLSLDYQRGQGRWIVFTWNDRERMLRIETDPRSRWSPAEPLRMEIKLISERQTRVTVFEGNPVEVSFR